MIGIVAEVVDDGLVVLVVDDGRGNILIGLLGVEVVVDILEPELTVYETLYYSAKFKLSYLLN